MNKRQKKKAYKKKYGVNPTDEVKAVCEALKHFPEIFEQLNDVIVKTLEAVSEFLAENVDFVKEAMQKWAEDTKDVGDEVTERIKKEVFKNN